MTVSTLDGLLKDFYGWLKDSGLCGGRVYPAPLPKEAKFPASVYFIVPGSTPLTVSHDREKSLMIPVRMQVSCWDLTLPGVLEQGAKAKDLGLSFEGGERSVVEGIRLADFNYFHEPDTGRYHFVNDFFISFHWLETIEDES